jgi:phage gpG-like protein
MLKETKLNFAKESTPDGAGWAALAASTLAQKSGGKILVESGALLGSIAIKGAGSKQAFITSTGVAYAIYHAAGTCKMPARKFIGISGRHETRINQIFKRYVKSLSL